MRRRTSLGLGQRVVRRRRGRDGFPADPGERLAVAVRRERRRVTEAVEELHLLLSVLPHRMIRGQILDERPDTCPELVREVRRRRPDEGVDVVAGGLDHG